MITVDFVRDKNEILQYRELWNEIYCTGENEPSTSFVWTNALLKTHRKEKDDFLLIIIKDSKEVISIVPIIISSQKKFGLSFTYMFPISEYYNTHSDILLKELYGEFIEVFIKAIFQLKPKWDIFSMRRLIESNPIIENIESILKKCSVKYRFSWEAPSFFLPLENNYDDYLKKRSGKFRNYLKRIEKKITFSGNIDFHEIEDLGGINDAYRALLEIEIKSWKHEHGTAISSISRQEKFYEELCVSANENGWLHMLFLYMDDKPIAYNMGLLKDSKYYYIRTSFDEELRRYGPSTLLRAQLIKRLISDRVEYFDFPGEPYEWERQWTEEMRWHRSLEVYNDTLKGKLYSAYRTYKKRRDGQRNEKVLQYCDPRNLKHK